MKKFNLVDDIHFVTFKTYKNQSYFKDNKCCQLFLENLDKLRFKFNFKIFAFCIMPDHVHLLIYPRVAANSFAAQDQATNEFVATQKQNISFLIKNIKGVSARKINKYLKRSGAFWQRDFYDFNIYSNKKFQEKLDYIHTNPLKAGLVKDISLYKYCSWRNYELNDQAIFKIDFFEY
jgi:putative transposase